METYIDAMQSYNEEKRNCSRAKPSYNETMTADNRAKESYIDAKHTYSCAKSSGTDTKSVYTDTMSKCSSAKPSYIDATHTYSCAKSSGSLAKRSHSEAKQNKKSENCFFMLKTKKIKKSCRTLPWQGSTINS